VSERFSSEGMARIRGSQAWALALLGHAAQSQQVIELAAREIDPKHRPELAGFHWRAGMAMLAIENSPSATGHFRRASSWTLKDYYGGLASTNSVRETQAMREIRGEYRDSLICGTFCDKA